MDEELTPLCRKNGIGLINASPLHQRLLTESGAPDWHRSPKPVLDIAPRIAEICRGYGVNVADVAMRFCLDHPYVATTIVGMSKTRHVESNLKALTFAIPEGLLQAIKTLVAPVKNLMWFEGLPENNIRPAHSGVWIPETPLQTH
jgi:L-galactose dehydrogenase